MTDKLTSLTSLHIIQLPQKESNEVHDQEHLLLALKLIYSKLFKRHLTIYKLSIQIK